jgi:hypothetical protein
VDIENGTPDGKAILLFPLEHHTHVLKELQQYYQSQNPTLGNDIKFYTECASADPDIPSTVFTRNIATVLSYRSYLKRLKRLDCVGDTSSRNDAPSKWEETSAHPDAAS